VVLAFRRLPGLAISPRLFDRRELRTAVSLGGSQTLVSLAGLLLLRTDPLIVGWRMPLEAVAAYAVALRIAEQAFMLVKQFVNALPPFIARLEGSGDRAALGRLLILGVRASLVPAALVALPLAAFSTQWLTVWVGPSIAAAGPALAVLAAATALMAPQMVISSLFTYTGRHALTGRIAIVSASVNIVLSVALVGPLGLTGVSLGTLTAVAVVDVAFAGHLAVRCFEVTPRALWIEGFGRALAPAAPAGIVAALIRDRYALDSLWQLAIASIVVVIAYLVGLWFTGVPREHRSAVADRLKSPWRLLGVPTKSGILRWVRS
jgi:O-antigen/teichoic acid export membrane protein